MLPSGWTCLGMIRHLAVDDERFWFRGVAAGGPVDFDDATGWQPSPGEPAEAVLELYRREIAASDKVLAGLDLDAPPARWAGVQSSLVAGGQLCGVLSGLQT